MGAKPLNHYKHFLSVFQNGEKGLLRDVHASDSFKFLFPAFCSISEIDFL